MERVEVYLTGSGNIRIDSFFEKNNEYVDYRLEGRRAEQFIEELSRESIRYAEEDGENLVITYNGLKLVINECTDILKNKKYADLFFPIILKIKHQEERKKVKELKNKTVIRKNKHIKSRIIATGLTLVTISGILIGIAKKQNKSETNKNDSITYIQLADEPEEKEDKFIELSNKYKEEDNEIIEVSSKHQDLNEEATSKVSDNLNIVSISYDDRTGSSKAINTENNYKRVIDKYSKIYGLDPKLMLALATQERGIHSTNLDSGGAIGLMQIQKNVWANHKLKAYNFQTKQYETIIVNPTDLSNLDYNVKLGCMIFQENLRNMNYNPLLALQSYNMGYGNMNRILANYCLDSKKTKEQVLNNINDTDWMGCRNLINVGDQKYVEHVLSYCGNNAKIINIKPDGTEIGININNKDNKKVY